MPPTRAKSIKTSFGIQWQTHKEIYDVVQVFLLFTVFEENSGRHVNTTAEMYTGKQPFDPWRYVLEIKVL